jgi:hypothetical protein
MSVTELSGRAFVLLWACRVCHSVTVTVSHCHSVMDAELNSTEAILNLQSNVAQPMRSKSTQNLTMNLPIMVNITCDLSLAVIKTAKIMEETRLRVGRVSVTHAHDHVASLFTSTTAPVATDKEHASQTKTY